MGKLKTNEQVIIDFKIVHDDKYDYSLVDYKGPYKKIKIICKEHDVFESSPSNHIKGMVVINVH